MHFQKPGRNSENLEKICKNNLATLGLVNKTKFLFKNLVLVYSIQLNQIML